MQIKIYNQEGEETGKVNLPDDIFNVKINRDLLHQVVVSQMSNKRIHLARSKDRSEVRGGGRKPWRQKGTGRARHGSIRSPIWRGGGVTFGPTGEENFKNKISKKMKRKALFMALSSKAKDKEIFVLDELKLAGPKTKLMASALDKIIKPKRKKNYNSLIILAGEDENTFRAAKNISETKILRADSLNALDLLSYKYLVMPEEAIGVIEKTYKK